MTNGKFGPLMIYLDNNATTHLAAPVIDAMVHHLSGTYGNPSSAHALGNEARRVVAGARESVARLIGAADPSEICFTSGGTESDNWAILGALRMQPGKRHIITTQVEHEAVRKLCQQLEKAGYSVTWLNVSDDGSLDLDQLRASLTPDTAVVSVMVANNETGVLFPVDEVGRVVKEKSDALFHVDGVNAAGKMPINLGSTAIDLLSISGHKFHGPKGIGALYIRRGVELPSMLVGGGQEYGRRPGTEAVHQVAGLGAAAEFVSDTGSLAAIRLLRDRLESAILNGIPDTRINGTTDTLRRLPNTSNISFENTNGEMILAKLNAEGICVSTGSACNDRGQRASAVLEAMNVPYSYAMGSIRFSLGRFNTEDEVDDVLGRLPRIIRDLRNLGK